MKYFSILFLFLSLGLTASKTITVLPFEVRTLSPEQAMVYTDNLRSVLVQSQNFKIMERERMELIYKKQGLQSSSSTSDQVKIGQLLKVEYHGGLRDFSSLAIPLIESLVTKITKLLVPSFSEENIPATGINEAYFVLNHTLLFPMKL